MFDIFTEFMRHLPPVLIPDVMRNGGNAANGDALTFLLIFGFRRGNRGGLGDFLQVTVAIGHIDHGHAIFEVTSDRLIG
ncbi:hypothetical protein WJ67_14755 [Burkholderia ubonensis]|nr:hypothetical protein WJ67_14755 [Burkholderia ubonensis]